MSQSHKPLPKLPPTTTTTTTDQTRVADGSLLKEKLEDSMRAGLLSVEGRLHRASLIRSFLADPEVRKDPWLYDRRDTWAYALEDAVDEFGRAMARGAWWKRIISGREAKAKMRLESLETFPTHHSDAGSSTTKAAAKEHSESTQHSKTDAKPLPARPYDPLKILQHLAAHSKGSNSPGHLLVCLTPHDRSTPLPFEDSGFDIIPSKIGCQFSPGSYSLQDEYKGSTVLFGLEELPATLLDVQDIPIQLIGGTFTFKGLIAPSQHALLATVLRLALYTHLNLLLEQHVLRDSGVQLDYRMPARRPTLSGPSSSTPPRVLTFSERAQRQRSHEQDQHEADEANANRPRLRTTFLPSSLTNFLSHLAPSASLPSNNGGLGLSSWAFGGKGKTSVQRAQTIGSPGDSLRRKEKSSKEAQAMTETKSLNPQSADTSIPILSDIVSSTSAPIMTTTLPNEETKLTTNDSNVITTSNKLPATNSPPHPNPSSPFSKATPSKSTSQPPPKFRRFSFISPLPPTMSTTSTSGAFSTDAQPTEKKPPNDRRHSIRRSVHAALGHLQMHAGPPTTRNGHSSVPNPVKASAAVQKQNGISGARSPMNQALRCINDSRGVLSTSIGVKFSPPRLVVELAQKEAEFSAQNPPQPKAPMRARSNSVPLQPTRKLKGDERAALSSLIGFGEDEKNGSSLEKRANEVQTSLEGVLSGMRGFVRFQGISVLWSEKVPCQTPSGSSTTKSSDIKEAQTDLTAASNSSKPPSAMNSLAGTLKSPQHPMHKPDFKDFLHCGKPEWRTWRFFVSEDEDSSQSSKPQEDHSRSTTSTSTNPNANTPQRTTDSEHSKLNPSDTTNPSSTPNRPTHTLTQSQESNILRSNNSKPSAPDPRLGTFLMSLVQQRKEKCKRPACSYDQGMHILRAVHAGVGVEIWVQDGEKEVREHIKVKTQDTTVGNLGKESLEATANFEEKAPIELKKDDDEVPVPVEAPGLQIEAAGDDKSNEKTPAPIIASHEDTSKADGLFDTWESCAVCGSQTVTRLFSEESSFFSFSKYLELLLYSPALCKLTPSLCSHTSLPTEDKSAAKASPEALSSVRYNIIRHFSHRGSSTQVSFAVFPVQDVYELQVPRLQIIRGSNNLSGATLIPPSRSPTHNLHQNNPILRGFVVQPPAQARKGDEKEMSPKRILRKEIRKWWEGVADHIDQIETVLKTYESTHKIQEVTAQEPSTSETEPDRSVTPRLKTSKALPRLPSADSAYEHFSSLDDDVGHSVEASGTLTPIPTFRQTQPPLSNSPSMSDHTRTPTGSTISPSDKDVNIHSTVTIESSAIIAAPTPLNTPSALSTSTQNTSTSTTSTVPPSIPPKDNSEMLLASLRYQMQTVEQNLYAQLARTPEANLNDVRRSFLATGRGTQKRLTAWKKKHLGDRGKTIGELGSVSRITTKRGKSDLQIQSVKGKEKEEVKDDETDGKEAKEAGTAKSDEDKNDPTQSMEPEWWKPGCHVLPGGNIIVREDDWGSIIAHTLSTSDYQLELSNLSMVLNRAPSKAGFSTLPTTPPIESPGTPGPTSSSFFSIGAGYNLFGSSNKNQPDPDRDDVVWNEPEEYSAVISRKDHVRDPASLLSIRGVLRHKVIAEVSSGTASPISQAPGNRKASVDSVTPSILAKIQGHSATKPPPPASVKAKPDVGLDIEPAGGELETPEQLLSSDVAGQILSRGIEAEKPPPSAFTGTWRRTSRPPSITSFEEDLSQSNMSMGRVDAHIERRKGSSVISLESTGSDKTIGREVKKGDNGILAEEAMPLGEDAGSTHTLPPPLPPKGDKEQAPPIPAKTVTTPPDPPSNTSSSITSTLANGLQSAMRYVMNTEPVSRIITPPLAAAPSPKKNHPHHHSLLADISNIDDRPHIKYDWTVGKRLKFSCTVYYAKQFDTLRRRCGVSDTFLKSLSRSANWTADGGKSRSNFWKTSDNKFIIKTLVNAWNVADLQVLIDHAPSYFQYIDSTASKPTVLAKLMGFYTVEIRNLETGNVQSRADLLVMENLFFDSNITKIFDLKGIQGRKVKARGRVSKTLFDGEWIEGQQRALTLIHPYSKVVLREAIKHDAEFLARSNIMDYSLLVGVDEDRKQIACGLVDTIGSYTFAKTLEYKAKHNLQGGKEVTVIPPAEYRERFITAMDGYFVACPDKWSKPLDHSQIISDPTLLPNIC